MIDNQYLFELNDTLDKFSMYYNGLGYKYTYPWKISSGLDKSVRFIGAQTSVWKQEILDCSIPKEGQYIIQPCIKNRNLSNMHNASKAVNLGSYYHSSGTLMSYKMKDKAIDDFFIFLIDELDIHPKDIQIKVRNVDDDLICPIKRLGIKDIITVNENNLEYIHQFGMDNILGRTVKIYHKSKLLPEKIAGVVAIDDCQKGSIAIETSFGALSTVKIKNDL